MEDTEAAPASQRAAKAPKFPCVRCKKNVPKNCKAVRCGTCLLWVHCECEKMPDEVYNILAHPEKHGFTVAWTCDACKECNARIDLMVKGLENRVKEVESRMDKADSRVDKVEYGIKDLDREVEKVKEAVKGKDEDTTRKVKGLEDAMMEELRERETKKNNVVMYKVEESDKEVGKERMAWDLKMCKEILDRFKKMPQL